MPELIPDPETDLEDDAAALEAEGAGGETDLEDDSESGTESGTEGEGDEDLGEGHDHGAEGEAARQAQARVPSRAQRRVETAVKAANAAKAEAEAARREAAELRAQVQGRQTQEQEALERERVALMSPEEKYEHLLRKSNEANDRRFAMLQYTQADATDRARFDSLCARQSQDGKLYAEISEEVETQLAEARRQGINLPRTTIAERILGQRFLSRAARAKPKQQRAAAERVGRETVRAPGGTSSNVGRQPARSGDADARAKRLEKLQI